MRAIRMLSICGLAAGCANDKIVAPERPADAVTADAPVAALSAAELATLAAAITDAQEWLLPSLGDRDVATDALAGRFADLATSLAQGETGALTSRIAAARQQLDALAAEPAVGPLIELAALGLALDQVEAVIQGRMRLVPFNPAPPDALPDAPRAANERQGPALDRSLP
jgi:hypothetical protein